MTPFRLLFALILASLFSQFPAFSNQYLLLMRAEIALLSNVISAHETSGAANTLAAPLAVTPQELDEIRLRLAKLEPAQERLIEVAPGRRLLRISSMNDPSLLGIAWERFAPSVPIGANGLLSALIGFAGGWLLAALIALPMRRRPE